MAYAGRDSQPLSFPRFWLLPPLGVAVPQHPDKTARSVRSSSQSISSSAKVRLSG